MHNTPGPVVQELDLTFDIPTDRALFQLGTLPSEVRSAILHHGPCRPEGPFAISSENGNRRMFSQTHYHANSEFWRYVHRTAIALLLTNDEEAISSKLLVVGRSIGNAKRVGQWCVRQTEELRSEDQLDIA